MLNSFLSQTMKFISQIENSKKIEEQTLLALATLRQLEKTINTIPETAKKEASRKRLQRIYSALTIIESEMYDIKDKAKNIKKPFLKPEYRILTADAFQQILIEKNKGYIISIETDNEPLNSILSIFDTLNKKLRCISTYTNGLLLFYTIDSKENIIDSILRMSADNAHVSNYIIRVGAIDKHSFPIALFAMPYFEEFISKKDVVHQEPEKTTILPDEKIKKTDPLRLLGSTACVLKRARILKKYHGQLNQSVLNEHIEYIKGLRAPVTSVAKKSTIMKAKTIINQLPILPPDPQAQTQEAQR